MIATQFGPRWRWGRTEKSRIVSTLDGPIYEMTRVRMPLLLRLDGLLAGAEATYDHPTVTIEHVLPQSPDADSQWMQWFPDEDERLHWTTGWRISSFYHDERTLGHPTLSLTARRKSTSTGRLPPFPLTMPVLQQAEWTPTVLETRQAFLLGRLKEEWNSILIRHDLRVQRLPHPRLETRRRRGDDMHCPAASTTNGRASCEPVVATHVTSD